MQLTAETQKRKEGQLGVRQTQRCIYVFLCVTHEKNFYPQPRFFLRSRWGMPPKSKGSSLSSFTSGFSGGFGFSDSFFLSFFFLLINGWFPTDPPADEAGHADYRRKFTKNTR